MTRKGRGISISASGKPKEEFKPSKANIRRMANMKKIEQRREDRALEREIAGVCG